MEKELNKKNRGIKIVITSIGGILWTVVCIGLGTMLFMQHKDSTRDIISKSGVKSSPHFLGGEIIETGETENFVIQMHEPVREGLRKKGRRLSVQIDWKYKNGEKPVGDYLVIYPGYEEPLAKISVDPKTEEINFEPIHPDVLGLMDMSTMAGWGYLVTDRGKKALLKYEDGVSVRIILRQRLKN